MPPSAPTVTVEPERSTTRARASKRRMLIVVNPYATTVSDRLKNLVVYALQGRYEVEAVQTEAQNHATEISRDAAREGYDVVCAFGGDGTLNEVANGLVGSDTPVTVLPGGSTNVVCRTLGIPNDVVDATEHLLRLADDFHPRRIDLGRAGGRLFVFACGVGLDATVVKRVDSNPRLKARAGEWYFTWAAVSGFYRRYLRNAVRIGVETDAGQTEGVTVVVQNSDPYTYFGDIPIRVCDDAGFASGTLSLAVLQRALQRDVPFVAGRVFAAGVRATNHRRIDGITGLTEGTVRSLSTDDRGEPRPMPVQLDGDYVGDHTALELGVEPRALLVVS